jgi:hypothetical protein
VRRLGREADALVLDLAAGRGVDPADQVEDRRLAGAVRADQGEDLAAADVEADVVDGDDAAEAHAEMARREQRLVDRVHFSRSDFRKLFCRLNMPLR